MPVSVPPGGSATATFGDQQQGTVSGTVYNDLNGNGVQDPGEPGLAGVVVSLIDSAGAWWQPPPPRAVAAISSPICRQGITLPCKRRPQRLCQHYAQRVSVNVPAGGSAAANFGDQQQGTVSGTVFNDLNGNGSQDVGEAGIPGVTMSLIDANGQIAHDHHRRQRRLWLYRRDAGQL